MIWLLRQSAAACKALVSATQRKALSSLSAAEVRWLRPFSRSISRTAYRRAALHPAPADARPPGSQTLVGSTKHSPKSRRLRSAEMRVASETQEECSL